MEFQVLRLPGPAVQSTSWRLGKAEVMHFTTHHGPNMMFSMETSPKLDHRPSISISFELLTYETVRKRPKTLEHRAKIAVF